MVLRHEQTGSLSSGQPREIPAPGWALSIGVAGRSAAGAVTVQGAPAEERGTRFARPRERSVATGDGAEARCTPCGKQTCKRLCPRRQALSSAPGIRGEVEMPLASGARPCYPGVGMGRRRAPWGRRAVRHFSGHARHARCGQKGPGVRGARQFSSIHSGIVTLDSQDATSGKREGFPLCWTSSFGSTASTS